jgi:hypothetical protein
MEILSIPLPRCCPGNHYFITTKYLEEYNLVDPSLTVPIKALFKKCFECHVDLNVPGVLYILINSDHESGLITAIGAASLDLRQKNVDECLCLS